MTMDACTGTCSVLALFKFIFDFLRIVVRSTYRLVVPVQQKSVRDDTVLVLDMGLDVNSPCGTLREGATIVCWDVNEEANQETIANIAQMGYRKAFAYTCDVTDRDSVFATAAQVLEDIGTVTILINNAGILPCRSFLEYTSDEIQKTMDINVMAHFWTIQAFLPKMKEINRGHIVAISSCVGLNGQKYLVPYCASKFAVRGLMESLNIELRSYRFNHIKTTTIYPFVVNTGLCKTITPRCKTLLRALEPNYIAKRIVEAQRRELHEVTLPRFLLTLSYAARLLPIEAAMLLQDLIGSSVEPQL